MSTHHRYSPSKLRDFENCPGYMNDEGQDTTAADEGTRLHLAAETGDFTGLDAEQTATVQKCLTYVEALKKDAIEDHKELKLTLGDTTSGTADRILIRPTKGFPGSVHLDVIDHKMGRNGVDDAAVNRQGMTYVLMALLKWKNAVSATVHFLLPRRDEVSKHTFYRKDIAHLQLTIQRIIDKAKEFERTKDVTLLNPTERCSYCGRRATCPALSSLAISYAKKYEPLELVEEVHSSQITDLAQAAKFLTVLRVLERMVDASKRHLTQLGMEHGGLPGPDGKIAYEVAEKAGARTITNPTVAYPILREYLDVEEIVQHCSIKLTGVLADIRAKAEKGQKTKVSGEVERKLGDAGCISSGDASHYLRKVKE